MQAAKLKLDMAKKMATSRSQLDRVLDPSNVSVQLDTLIKAARARQRDRGQDQTRPQKGRGMNGARGRALAGLLPKSVTLTRARLLRDFVERPWARLNIRGAADVPETN